MVVTTMSHRPRAAFELQRAVFREIPAEPHAAPTWFERTEERVRPGLRKTVSAPPSAPPSAELAEKLEAPRQKRERSDSTRPSDRGRPSRPLPPDSLYDERIKGAQLTATMGDSWQASSSRTDDSRRAEQALEEVRKALIEFEADRTEMIYEAEKRLIEIVRLVALRVLERELKGDDLLPARLIHSALSALADSSQIVVQLGAGFEVEAPVLLAALENDGIKAELIIDPRLSPYGCKVRSGLGEVDESIETRLENLLSGLDDSDSEEAE